MTPGRCRGRSTTNKDFDNFWDIDVLKPYVGFIYRYAQRTRVRRFDYQGQKRQAEHKPSRTNTFGRAIQQYGYNSFAFDVLEKLKFSERQELYDLEDEDITKYDSINNGLSQDGTNAKKLNRPTRVS